MVPGVLALTRIPAPLSLSQTITGFGDRLANVVRGEGSSCATYLRNAFVASQFHYFIAGLTVSSEIELPRLPEWTGDSLPDVRICCGNVPDQLPDVVDRGPVYQTAPGQLLFRIEAVAAFYVCNGNEIVVQPARCAGVLRRRRGHL